MHSIANKFKSTSRICAFIFSTLCFLNVHAENLRNIKLFEITGLHRQVTSESLGIQKLTILSNCSSSRIAMLSVLDLSAGRTECELFLRVNDRMSSDQKLRPGTSSQNFSTLQFGATRPVWRIFKSLSNYGHIVFNEIPRNPEVPLICDLVAREAGLQISILEIKSSGETESKPMIKDLVPCGFVALRLPGKSGTEEASNQLHWPEKIDAEIADVSSRLTAYLVGIAMQSGKLN